MGINCKGPKEKRKEATGSLVIVMLDHYVQSNIKLEEINSV